MYRVDHIFPPDINHQIPWKRCIWSKKNFWWNVDMVVVYYVTYKFFNKTSHSLCNRSKSSEGEKPFYTHLALWKSKMCKQPFFLKILKKTLSGLILKSIINRICTIGICLQISRGCTCINSNSVNLPSFTFKVSHKMNLNA